MNTTDVFQTCDGLEPTLRNDTDDPSWQPPGVGRPAMSLPVPPGIEGSLVVVPTSAGLWPRLYEGVQGAGTTIGFAPLV